MTRRRRRWSLHFCTPWECGYGSAIWRVNLSTPLFWFGLALEPGSRFVGDRDDPKVYWNDFRRWSPGELERLDQSPPERED